jgi:prevent-host-death family protein
MTMLDPGHWQIQEAKQRFSEVIRAVRQEGPQIITRHGEDVAVILDIRDYHRLADSGQELKNLLLSGPRFDEDTAAIFEEIELERKADHGRTLELGDEG